MVCSIGACGLPLLGFREEAGACPDPLIQSDSRRQEKPYLYETQTGLKGLVTNYGEGGGGYKTGGGAHEVLPLRKGGGGGKSFSHSEGGAQKVLGLFLRGSLKFKPYCRGRGRVKFPLYKRGGAKSFTLS